MAIVTRWLIPSWYAVAMKLTNGLLLVQLVAAIVVARLLMRRPGWRWPRKVAAVVGLLALLLAGFFAAFHAETREGIFVCGRELYDTVDCPGGGQAFEYVSTCIAGNPHVQVELRPGWLPVMYRVSGESGVDACRQAATWAEGRPSRKPWP